MNPTSVGIEQLSPAEKIDGELRAAMRIDTRVPVLLLASQQRIAGGRSFAEFTQQHSRADRRSLRSTITGELKALADEHRTGIIDPAWPAEARATGLWLVNGAVALLTREEIARAAESEDVAYLYLLDRIPPASVTGAATVVSAGAAPRFDPAGKSVSWTLTKLNAPAVWSAGFDGSGTVTALIDEGVVLTHSDLSNHIWVNVRETPDNGVDDDGNGYIDDVHGYDFARNSPNVGNPLGNHGTFVAGIIAGDGTGGLITGMAPRTRIMALRGASFAEAALALQYAVENGADVVNMSFSIPGEGQLRAAWRLLADHAVAAGLVLVSGAGNFQQSAPHPVQLRTPEDIPSVIAVGGVDEREQLAPFSSTGPVEWGSIRFFRDHGLPEGLVKPDVAAFPGPGFPILRPSGGYIDPNPATGGNSFSGPHVAGAAALLLGARPDLPAWRVSEVLQATARDLPPAGKDNRTGAGLIDVAAALQHIRQ